MERDVEQPPAPMLLLPGLLCDARIWAPQLAAFPDAVAARPYGLSRSLAEMAAIVLAAAPPRFALVGHSMGARVALEVVRAAPERVERLALLDTGVHLPRAGEAASRHALLDVGRREGAGALVDRWLPPMLAGDDPALLARLRAMCVALGVDSYEAQIAALLARPEVETLLEHITCPVLLGVGRHDRWSPVGQHAAMAAVIPDAVLVVFEDAGHMAPVEAPAAVNAALDAWRRRPHSRTTGERQ